MVEQKPRLARFLSPSEIQYVISHLRQIMDCGFDWKVHFVYENSIPESLPSSCFFFPISSAGWDAAVNIDGIPILFTSSCKVEPFYEFGKSIVFNHDFIKSAFFLLSSYQELEEDANRDSMGRFLYEGSVQQKLNIAHIPVVNYYFDWIRKGIERWCILNGKFFKYVTLFRNPSIHLTHNVNNLRYFRGANVIRGWGEILGIKEIDYSRKKKTKAMVYAAKQMFRTIDNERNPWWVFSKVQSIESCFDFNSTWFFASQYDYNLSEPDIRSAMHQISSKGDDIGLLSPSEITNTKEYTSHKSLLRENCIESLPYCRQSKLAISGVDQLYNMEQSNIMVDCSWGFVDHVGFRNSYCYPFYPYDHKHQCSLGILEIPLAINDSNLLIDKVLDIEQLYEVLEQYLDQIRKFNGLLSVLLRNTTFDEFKNPDMYKTYEDMLRYFSQYQVDAPTTTEVVRRMISVGGQMF